MKRIAIFPGSFDPYTIGHDSVVRRALPLFDKIVIGVGVNKDKRSMLPVAQRIENIRTVYENEPKIEVKSYETLTTVFAEQEGAKFILRGLRSVKDFEYERDIAEINKETSGVETVLLFTEHEYGSVSSSTIRELMAYGQDVSRYLPKPRKK